MANRSYLYSTNVMPGPNAKDQGAKLVGVSEWNYDIPIVFKLLLSGNPKMCPSSIWDMDENIALIGDYASGVKNLEKFLSDITLPSAQPLIVEALEFLHKPETQNQYFVLEGGEIFEMDEAPLQEQNQTLLNQIYNLQPEIDAAMQSIMPPPTEPASFFSKILGRKSKSRKQETHHDPMQAIHFMGLGNWSNILYFDFENA